MAKELEDTDAWSHDVEELVASRDKGYHELVLSIQSSSI